jgi:hypothetical protein
MSTVVETKHLLEVKVEASLHQRQDRMMHVLSQ